MAKKKKKSTTRHAEHVELPWLDTTDKCVNDEHSYTTETQPPASAEIEDTVTVPGSLDNFHEPAGNSELHQDPQDTEPPLEDKFHTMSTQASIEFNAWVQACGERKRAEANTALAQADAIDAKVARLGLLEDERGALEEKIRATDEEMRGLLRDIEKSCHGILPFRGVDSTCPTFGDHSGYADC